MYAFLKIVSVYCRNFLSKPVSQLVRLLTLLLLVKILRMSKAAQ